MKLILILFFAVISIKFAYSQKLDELSYISNQKQNITSGNKYFNSSHRWTFEYGVLVNITQLAKSKRDAAIAHSLSADYNFNLKSNKLFGSIKPGLYYVPGESGALSLALGLNYVFYQKGIFNLSVYAGMEGLLSGGMPGFFAESKINASIQFNKRWAFTAGVKYLYGSSEEHWIMPSIGYQYLLP
jgi:hypothetical protein